MRERRERGGERARKSEREREGERERGEKKRERERGRESWYLGSGQQFTYADNAPHSHINTSNNLSIWTLTKHKSKTFTVVYLKHRERA